MEVGVEVVEEVGLGVRGRHERLLPGHRVEQHPREGVDVAAAVAGAALEPFGRHVGQGADQPWAGVGGGGVRVPGDPEIDQVQARRRGDFVHLIDFGIARHADTTATHTGPGLVGTLTYMAPERFEGGPGDSRSDVYALAGVLFYAVTGQKPFVAPPNTEPDLLYYLNSHLHRPPPRPSDHASAVARAELARLDPVVARGMAKRPTERYASAGELAAAAHTALDTSAGNGSDSSPTVRAPHGFEHRPPGPHYSAARPAGRVGPTAVPPRAFVPTGRRVTPTSTPHDHTARVGGYPTAADRRRHRGAGRHARPGRSGADVGEPPHPGLVLLQPTTPAVAPIIEHALTGHTDRVYAVATALLDGRPVVVTGSADDDGAGVGPGHRRPGRRPLHRPHRRGDRGGDRAARRARRRDLRQRRHDGAGVGPGHRQPGRRPLHRPHRPGVRGGDRAARRARRSRSPAAPTTTVRVWDLATGDPSAPRSPATPGRVRRWRPRSSTGAPVAITGSHDTTVRVWDLATGNPVGAPLTGHTG